MQPNVSGTDFLKDDLDKKKLCAFFQVLFSLFLLDEVFEKDGKADEKLRYNNNLKPADFKIGAYT